MTLVFDKEELVERLGGRVDMLPRLLEMFRNNTAGNIEALRQAIVSGDDEQVRIQAHSIKGAAANISANRMKETAFALEMLVHDGQRDGRRELVARLESELREFSEISAQSCGKPADEIHPG